MPAVGTVLRPGWSVAGEEKVSARTPENEAASGAHFRMPQWLGKPEGTVSAPPRTRVYGNPTEVENSTEVDPS